MALAAIVLSLLLVAVAPATGTCSEELAPVLQCHPAPALTDATDGAAFRASLLPLLVALPSAAALTGFASLHSDGAFARGFCFGESTTMLPSDSECALCLSDAARNLTAGCGATSRRAGILSDRCSLSYADTNFSSPGQDAFRARLHFPAPGDDAVPASDSDTSAGFLYSAGLHDELVAMAQLVAQRAAARLTRPAMVSTTRVIHKTIVERGGCGCDYAVVRSTVHVRAQCASDLTAADCARCLQDSAQAVGWDLDAARGDGGAAAAVVGFNCHVRFEVSTALVPRSDQSDDPSDHSGLLHLGLLALVMANLILTVANHCIPSGR